MPSAFCMNRRFEGTFCLRHQGDKNQRARNVSSNKQLKHAAAKKYYVMYYYSSSILVM
jgi:hypothetical protein